MPNWTTHNWHSPLYLQHLVNPKYVQRREDILSNENQFHYVPINYHSEYDGLQFVLNGYYQSEKFFIDFKDEILDLFEYHWQLQEGFVSVHLRRTDFLQLQNKHPVIFDEWYEEAMGLFPGKQFLFFSDEIGYAKKIWGHRSDCFFSEGRTIEQDMIDASCCENNICSASTYAWWQMYLNRNPDKKVVFPKTWFTPGWDNANTNDILPEWVIKL